MPSSPLAFYLLLRACWPPSRTHSGCGGTRRAWRGCSDPVRRWPCRWCRPRLRCRAGVAAARRRSHRRRRCAGRGCRRTRCSLRVRVVRPEQRGQVGRHLLIAHVPVRRVADQLVEVGDQLRHLRACVATELRRRRKLGQLAQRVARRDEMTMRFVRITRCWPAADCPAADGCCPAADGCCACCRLGSLPTVPAAVDSAAAAAGRLRRRCRLRRRRRLPAGRRGCRLDGEAVVDEVIDGSACAAVGALVARLVDASVFGVDGVPAIPAAYAVMCVRTSISLARVASSIVAPTLSSARRWCPSRPESRWTTSKRCRFRRSR